MKKTIVGVAAAMMMASCLICTPVYAAPRAGVIKAVEPLMVASSEEKVPVSEAISFDSETVWTATGLRTDTHWMNSIGSWQDVAQTAPYFTGEKEFDFLRFLGDYGAELSDIVIRRNEAAEPVDYILSYLKDGFMFQVVSSVDGSSYYSAFGAVGLDGLFYSAMTEADYWNAIGDNGRTNAAFERAAQQDCIVDSEEGFFVTDEIFNDFILVTLANPRMIYPEDQTGEMITKLCPFDGILPHFVSGDSITCLSAKHSSIATFGSDWDSIYERNHPTDGIDRYEDIGN